VQGNVVGPGCVHGCIDVKGIGSPAMPAKVNLNVATCGYSQRLCGCQIEGTCQKEQNPAYFTENTYASNQTLTFYGNLAYDSGIGFQDCPGGCSNGSGCAMNVNYYNNTAYIERGIPNSYGLYADISCGGAAAPGAQRIAVRNNIFDGASNYSVYIGPGFRTTSEDYNNIGGLQGSPGLMVSGSSAKGPHDLSNVNPKYINQAGRDFRLQRDSPCVNAGLPVLEHSLGNIGAF